MSDEEPLTGGNTSTVVRVGDTVRRSAGHWTPAVHALLNHCAAQGFAGVPRVLGTDDQGREVLEYVPGEVGTLSPDDPLPHWFRGPDACRAIGTWIAGFQHSQRGFEPDPALPWRRAPGGPLSPGQVLVHHDVSPYNTVRRDDGSLVVLDWDFTRPGDPLEDLAWAAWLWVPLRTADDTWWHREWGVEDAGQLPVRQERRLIALLEGYGADTRQRARLAEAITAQMLGHADDLDEMAATDPAFARLIDLGYADAARADARWWQRSPLRATITA